MDDYKFSLDSLLEELPYEPDSPKTELPTTPQSPPPPVDYKSQPEKWELPLTETSELLSHGSESPLPPPPQVEPFESHSLPPEEVFVADTLPELSKDDGNEVPSSSSSDSGVVSKEEEVPSSSSSDSGVVSKEEDESLSLDLSLASVVSSSIGESDRSLTSNLSSLATSSLPSTNLRLSLNPVRPDPIPAFQSSLFPSGPIIPAESPTADTIGPFTGESTASQGSCAFSFSGLQGPSESSLPEMTYTVLTLPLYIGLLQDMSFLNAFPLLSAGGRGLWLIQEDGKPVQIKKTKSHGMCLTRDNKHMYCTDGSSYIRKYDLLHDRLEDTEGGFEVEGAQDPKGIAASLGELLAIADVHRVTLHDFEGRLVHEIKGIFEEGQPRWVDWIDDDVLCILVRDGKGLGWVKYLTVSTGEVSWISPPLTKPWLVSCVGGFVFISHWWTNTISVLNHNGNLLGDLEIKCSAEQATRIVSLSTGTVTAVSFSRKPLVK